MYVHAKDERGRGIVCEEWEGNTAAELRSVKV